MKVSLKQPTVKLATFYQGIFRTGRIDLPVNTAKWALDQTRFINRELIQFSIPTSFIKY